MNLTNACLSRGRFLTLTAAGIVGTAVTALASVGAHAQAVAPERFLQIDDPSAAAVADAQDRETADALPINASMLAACQALGLSQKMLTNRRTQQCLATIDVTSVKDIRDFETVAARWLAKQGPVNPRQGMALFTAWTLVCIQVAQAKA